MAKILIATRKQYWGRAIASLLENKNHIIFYSLDKKSTLNIVNEVSLDAALMGLNIAKSALEEVLAKIPGLPVAVLGDKPYGIAKEIERSNVKYFEIIGAVHFSIADHLHESVSARAGA